MGFFDGLNQMADNAFKYDWSKTWKDLWDNGAQNLYHGFLKAASSWWDFASTPLDPTSDGKAARQQLWSGLKEMGSGLGGLGAGVGSLPVVRQVGEASGWATNEVVKRPLTAFNLVTGDIPYKGFGNVFSGDAWRQAYDDSRYASFGQSTAYRGASWALNIDKALGIYDYTNPDDRAWVQSHFGWLPFGLGEPTPSPEDLDPRTAAAQDRYRTNFWLKASSGTLDASADILADPTRGLGAAARAGKLKYWSQTLDASTANKLVTNPDRWQSYVDSNRYQKTYDFIQKNASTPQGVERIRQTIFNNHINGGVMANALADVSSDPHLYSLTWRAFYGDPDAWDQLTTQAPRIADMTGSKYANFSISQVAKNYGVGDPGADNAAKNLVETKTQAFADAMANSKGMWGKVGQGVKAGGLLTGQTRPYLSLTSQWRVGVNQLLNYGPSTIFGNWFGPTNYTLSSITRLFLPSSRGGRHLDLNNPDSLRIFRNNLLQSRLDQGQVDYWVNQYSRASSPESRFNVVNLAENAAFAAHAAAHGVSANDVQQVLPQLNQFRAYNRAFVQTNKRFISSDALKLAEQYRAQGMTAEADRVSAVAGQIDQSVKNGTFPSSVIASLDQDGNLAYIPVDSALDPSRPGLLSQTADTHVMQDWGALDSALWWRGKGALGTGIWKSKEALSALSDAATAAWKIGAILRPGYLWRPLTDEAGGPLSVMGAFGAISAATEGTKNAFFNTINRGALMGDVVRQAVTKDKLARIAGKGRRPVEVAPVSEAPSAGSELGINGTHPDLPGYVFGSGVGYQSYDHAVADGLISVPDFMRRMMDHGDNGNLPEAYQAIYNSVKGGLITPDEAQRFALDEAMANAGRNAYQSPSWQQAVIQSAIDARVGKPQGAVGAGEGFKPFDTATGPAPDLNDFNRRASAAAFDQAAIDAVPARLRTTYGTAANRHHSPEPGEVVWSHGEPDWLDAEFADTVKALEHYMGPGFTPINTTLRNGGLTDQQIAVDTMDDPAVYRSRVAGWISRIDNLMQSSALTHDIRVIRELQSGRNIFGSDVANKDLTGFEWTDPSFVSTTAHVTPSGSYSMTPTAPVMNIVVPKGTGAVSLSPLFMASGAHDEGEILLQRGLRFRVVKDHGVVDDKRNLDVEVVPSQGLVVDPASGSSPLVSGTQIGDNFKLTNTVRVPANVANFDQVYGYIHQNLDDLLKPDSLLHAYVQPDGNLALSVASRKPESTVDAVKPSAGVRVGVPFSSVKGKPLRASGMTGFDVMAGGRTYHILGAFEGQQGDLFRRQASTKGTVEAWVDRMSDTQKARLMAMTPTQWRNVNPDDAGYDLAWERAAMQLGNDPVARQFLKGDTPDQAASHTDVVAWMHNTDAGRAYQYRLGPWLPQYYDQIHLVHGMVDTYVPFNPDRLEESAALRQKVANGTATYKDLQQVVSQDQMPQVHGATLEHATGVGYFSHLVRKWTSDAFRYIGDMPNDTLLRYPLANERYQTYVQQAMQSRAHWLTGEEFTQGDLDAVQSLARERALVDVRKYLYDSMAGSDLARGLRLFVPFGSALYDSAAKWGTVLRENPGRIAPLWRIWSAPDTNGLVQDNDGNHLEVDNGKERWYYVDPKTGTRVYQPDTFVPNGKNIVFRLPFGVKVAGAHPGVSINKQAFQTFLDMPTFGPLVAIPANNFALQHPEWANNQFVKTFILPYGPSANGASAAIPGNIRNWKDAWDTFVSKQDTENSENQALQIWSAEMVAYSQGKRNNPPTFEEARQKAAQLAGLRFISRLSGATASFTTPYQPYVDYYHILEAKPRKPTDPTADEEFYNQMGPEFFWLTSRVTQNALGIPATLQSDAAYKKYSDLMQQFPDLAPLIEGSEGAGAFSKAVYEAQKATPIRYGTQTHERQLLTLEQSAEDVQKRLGWVKYTQFSDALHADMAARGITNLNQKGAEDLAQAKQDFLDNNTFWVDPYGATQVSPWFQDYSTTDQSKVESRLTQMRQIVQDGRLQNRDDIRGLIDYLDARDQFKAYMDSQGISQLSSKDKQSAPLYNQWQDFVFGLKESNLSFAQLYDRWLSHDETLAAQ